MKVDPRIPLVEINDILLKPLAATSSEFFAGTRLVGFIAFHICHVLLAVQNPL